MRTPTRAHARRIVRYIDPVLPCISLFSQCRYERFEGLLAAAMAGAGLTGVGSKEIYPWPKPNRFRLKPLLELDIV